MTVGYDSVVSRKR